MIELSIRGVGPAGGGRRRCGQRVQGGAPYRGRPTKTAESPQSLAKAGDALPGDVATCKTRGAPVFMSLTEHHRRAGGDSRLPGRALIHDHAASRMSAGRWPCWCIVITGPGSRASSAWPGSSRRAGSGPRRAGASLRARPGWVETCPHANSRRHGPPRADRLQRHATARGGTAAAGIRLGDTNARAPDRGQPMMAPHPSPS